jgi:hypothetical protein
VNEKEIVEGLLRVEDYNTQFRTVNPNGKYPVCASIPGNLPLRCERCGGYAGYACPCPAVPPEKRWGPDADTDKGEVEK